MYSVLQAYGLAKRAPTQTLLTLRLCEVHVVGFRVYRLRA